MKVDPDSDRLQVLEPFSAWDGQDLTDLVVTQVDLGGVVGAALAVNTVVAVSIGGVVPLLLRRCGFDPALASGPILTTVTDIVGLFVFLGLATMFLI